MEQFPAVWRASLLMPRERAAVFDVMHVLRLTRASSSACVNDGVSPGRQARVRHRRTGLDDRRAVR